MDIGKKINDWLTDVLTDCMGFFINLFNEVIGLLTENIDLVGTWYVLFVSICGILLVCIVLYRILSSIWSEAYSSEVAVSHIILDAIKASAAIPVMTFAQTFLQGSIIFPLLNYLFNKQSMFTADAITGVSKIGDIELTGFVFVLFLLFFAVVLGVFFVKMCIYYAEMVFFTLAVPGAAISIVTENFDFSQTWWRKLLYLNLSLLAQVLSLTLMVFGVTHLSDGFLYFMLAVGSGVLLMRAPSVIEDFWSSTGTTRKFSTGMTHLLMRKLGRN